ncbi:MAG: prephenate dehydrogenase [Firmicutes bacterium ADurb.Bin193]|nr:MAG: prephenate dehydrogenase [Firmicutes bacterium ADurb.Bin193]
MKELTVTIVGLGLIGGSIARSLKSHVKKLYAIDRDKSIIDFAVGQGVIDPSPKDPLCESDVVILCIYPAAALDFLRENKDRIKKGAVVTDVVGIKTPLMELYNELKPDFTYIGGHPMAGREVSGFINSDGGLFEGASFIMTPCEGAGEGAVSVVEAIATAIGCRIVIRTTTEDHDRIIAYTSQLPHVIATAMCDTPLLVKHKNFTGGSFEDVTRVAKINEYLWAELFISNREYLTEEIDRFTKSLGRIKTAIEACDSDGLMRIMRKVRQDKEMIDNA